LEKGDYGYIEKYKKRLLISIIVLGLIIILGVFFSVAVFDTRKNLFILLPILTSLPFAKQLVSYILCADFKPLSKEEYELVNHKISYGGSDDIVYDISLSRYEGILFFPAAVVRNGRIIFLYTDKFKKKYPDMDSIKKEIEKSFANQKKPYVILVTGSVKEFIKKANTLKEPGEEFISRDKKMRNTLFELGV